MIKAIFLDWGHVFTKGFKDRVLQINNLLKPLGLDQEEFEPYWRQFYILRSAGKIKNDRDFEVSIQKATGKEIPVEKIIDIRIASHLIPKEHIEIIKNLKKEYKVGILSNNVKEWVDRVLKNYQIENLFDVVIVSSKIGVRKPNAFIYYEALKRLSVKPEEAVFIADEVAEDLVAAGGLGMKTIWLQTDYTGWWREIDKRVLEIYQPDATIENLKELISIIKTM